MSSGSIVGRLGGAIRNAVVRGIARFAVFSSFIALFYRGRRLSEIGSPRCGLVGALVARPFGER